MAAALLCSTALTAPTQAAAGPVVGFVQGFVAAVSGAAVAGGAGVLAGYTTGIYVAGFFGTIAGRALLALGTSALTAALMPRPEMPKPSRRMETYVQPVTPMERGYGRIRKSGPVGYRSGIVQKRLHWTITIAAHSTKGPVRHWLDLREVVRAEDSALAGSLDDDLVVTRPYGFQDDLGNEDSLVSIRPYTGKAGQAADATLVADFTQVTTAHDFAGHSYAALWARRPRRERQLQVYSQGREPVYSAVWDMWDEIYDPRVDSEGWSDNWALCWAHELTQVWGLTGPGADRLSIEADICDETVTNRSGGSQARYTFAHVFSDDMDFEQVATQFLAAANGFMWQRADGAVDFYAGRWIAPSLTLVADDFLEVTVIDGNLGLRPPTHYQIDYTEPSNDYRETPSAAYVVDAVAPRVTRRLAVYGINNHNQALRVLSAIGQTDRGRWRLQGVVGLVGYEMIAGRDHEGDTTGAGGLAHRFVTVDLPMWDTPVTFEVSKIEANGDGNTFSVELTETSEEVWDFVAATDEPEPPTYNNAAVAGSDDIDTISDLAGEVVEGTGGVAQIRWFWTAADASLSPVLRLREESGSWVELQLQSGADEYVQTGLVDGATYEAQIRTISGRYELSDWLPTTPLSVDAVANTVAPSVHQAFALSETGGDVTVSWTAPDDVQYYATRIYRADYASGYSGSYDIADAVLVQTEYGLFDAPDSWVDASLSAGHYAYWIDPINASGVNGPDSGPETIEIV